MALSNMNTRNTNSSSTKILEPNTGGTDPSATQNLQDQRPSGWRFPARVTMYFLIVAAVAFGALSWVGLQSLNDVHDDNVATRLQRASQASSALALERIEGLEIQFAEDGSPQLYILEDEADLAPGDQWDSLLDIIGGANDGAANLFGFNITLTSV